MIFYVEQLLRHSPGFKTSVIYLNQKWKKISFPSFSDSDRNTSVTVFCCKQDPAWYVGNIQAPDNP